MAISPNFTSSESLYSNNLVTFEDTSTGDPTGLTSRRISIELADSTWLDTSGVSTTRTYITWPIADATITLDLLDYSTAASATVQWMTGSTVTNELTLPVEWILYDVLFLFGLLSTQTSNPTIIADKDYYNNFLNMIVNLYASEIAIEDMDDIFSAQEALDRNKYMIDHQNLFF